MFFITITLQTYNIYIIQPKKTQSILRKMLNITYYTLNIIHEVKSVKCKILNIKCNMYK